jgi:hypothetical protein
MIRKLMVFAFVVGVGSLAAAQELPPIPQIVTPPPMGPCGYLPCPPPPPPCCIDPLPKIEPLPLPPPPPQPARARMAPQVERARATIYTPEPAPRALPRRK